MLSRLSTISTLCFSCSQVTMAYYRCGPTAIGSRTSWGPVSSPSVETKTFTRPLSGNFDRIFNAFERTNAFEYVKTFESKDGPKDERVVGHGEIVVNRWVMIIINYCVNYCMTVGCMKSNRHDSFGSFLYSPLCWILALRISKRLSITRSYSHSNKYIFFVTY